MTDNDLVLLAIYGDLLIFSHQYMFGANLGGTKLGMNER